MRINEEEDALLMDPVSTTDNATLQYPNGQPLHCGNI